MVSELILNIVQDKSESKSSSGQSQGEASPARRQLWNEEQDEAIIKLVAKFGTK